MWLYSTLKRVIYYPMCNTLPYSVILYPGVCEIVVGVLFFVDLVYFCSSFEHYYYYYDTSPGLGLTEVPSGVPQTHLCQSTVSTPPRAAISLVLLRV